ncbi:MAG: ABC transporter ATP-binding protein [Thermodesulfobacteriota bacterium]|jgi:phospholipid/cholesterol/gamma-HCH transport system ATP-binding protein|nr:ATP-binding cassette domain-containing protein [Candidatus Dadabacteria bacterium]|tara:strand:- start:1979 stop:2689 length:711 start_codon:yes stop_codon:yes gene_type:complete
MERNISFININKSFSGKRVLDSFNHQFELNKVHVILGKSGMGKSVLLKSLMGLIEIDDGEILINNKNLRSIKEDDKFNISYVFQFSALLNSLSVIENITLYLDEKNIGSKEERLIKANKILKDLGLEDSSEKIPSDLSGGMRKRAAIARSLMIEPQILLYDEPTAELDQINTKIISDIILDLKNEKKITQLVVTHDVAFAKSIADTLSILDDGKITLTTNKEGIEGLDHPLVNPLK